MAGIESHANWDVCWKLPLSGNQSGGGLQILTANYDNEPVLRRGTQPFVLVPYHGAGQVYKDGLSPIGARYTPVKKTAPNAGSGHTTAASNLSDIVAVEKKPPTPTEPEKLVIWAKFQAAWYQYVHRWEFLADGRIKPGVGLGGPLGGPRSHVHNFYFRLDFALGQGGNQAVEEQIHNFSYPPGDNWNRLTSETKETARSLDAPRWRIRDTGTDQSYEIVPGSIDPPDGTYSTGDLWVVQRKGYSAELGHNVGIRDDHIENQYASGRSIRGDDVIIWHALREHHHPIPNGEERDTLPYHFMHFELKPRNFLNSTPKRLYDTNPPSPLP